MRGTTRSGLMAAAGLALVAAVLILASCNEPAATPGVGVGGQSPSWIATGTEVARLDVSAIGAACEVSIPQQMQQKVQRTWRAFVRQDPRWSGDDSDFAEATVTVTPLVAFGDVGGERGDPFDYHAAQAYRAAVFLRSGQVGEYVLRHTADPTDVEEHPGSSGGRYASATRTALMKLSAHFQGRPFSYRVTMGESWVLGRLNGESAGVFLGNCTTAAGDANADGALEEYVKPGVVLEDSELDAALRTMWKVIHEPRE